jgi:GrpB-like predicted nucleotidyltransferase (UPF0157 family)
VPGLGAKDIIDIQVTVEELDPMIIEKMSGAGYRHRSNMTDHVPPGEDPNPGLWTKFLFREPEGQRRVHIHVRKSGNPNQRYPLLFRDYLCAHPKSAMAIEQIKRQIARYHPDDIDAYLAIKEPAYDLIWDAAQEWARHTNWDNSI